MKYPAALCFLVLFTCGCNRIDVKTKFLNEQKSLKDSANKISERIGGYIGKGQHDSAEAERKHLGAVYTRLISIQSSLDSLGKRKK